MHVDHHKYVYFIFYPQMFLTKGDSTSRRLQTFQRFLKSSLLYTVLSQLNPFDNPTSVSSILFLSLSHRLLNLQGLSPHLFFHNEILNLLVLTFLLSLKIDRVTSEEGPEIDFINSRKIMTKYSLRLIRKRSLQYLTIRSEVEILNI
jgi:hypothetical protein